MWEKLVRFWADIRAALSAAVAALTTAISIFTTLLLAASCIFCAVRVATINTYLVVYLAAWDWPGVTDAMSACLSEPDSISVISALCFKLFGPFVHVMHIFHSLKSGMAKVVSKFYKTAQILSKIWRK